MTRRVSVSVIGLALLLVCPMTALAQSQASADALRVWVKAVKQHTPGQPDTEVAIVASLRYSHRVLLNPAMELFFRLIEGRHTVLVRSDAQHTIATLFESVQEDPGIQAFLRRAAVLHADAAIYGDRFPPPADDAPTVPAPRPGRPVVEPTPLLWNDRYVRQTDGRLIDDIPANWNWPFARRLLDLLRADRVFVSQWYHAVDAYMMAAGDLGSLKAQLRHIAGLLPDDPHIVFDRACYAESMGLAYIQAVRDDPGYSRAAGNDAMVPTESDTNGEAEKLFRRAVEIDGGYTEARVRLARLLERRGRHDEAAAEIEQALSPPSPPIVAFFAHIVAGRIELSRGHARESLGQYRAAVALFPDAQSALVGASHAAVMASDVGGARSFLARLGDRSGGLESDPWWRYHYGAGRDSKSLLAAAWALAQQKTP